MVDFQSKYFGNIKHEELADNFFEGEIEFKNDLIPIEFEVIQKLELSVLKKIDDFLDNFELNYLKIKNELKSKLYQTGFVKDYISIIKDDFKKELKDLLKGTDLNLNQEERLFSQLYICRMEFYQNSDNFAILDFTIDEGATNELLVVGINESSDVIYTMMES